MNGLLWAGDLGVFTGSESWDTWQFDSAVTALWCSTGLLDVKISELAAGSLDNSDLVGSSVVWVSASVGQSVGRHLGGFLIRWSIEVVGVVVES